MFGKFALPIVAAGLATTLGVFASPAMADPSNPMVSIAVDHRGVDLASAEGRQILDRRINAAINNICGQPVYGTRDEADVLRECRREVRAAVEPQVQMVLTRAPR